MFLNIFLYFCVSNLLQKFVIKKKNSRFYTLMVFIEKSEILKIGDG